MSLLITVGLCSGFSVCQVQRCKRWLLLSPLAVAVSGHCGAHLRAALCTCLSESPRFAASSDFLLIVMYLLQ